MGSLEKGKDADFVIWSGSPLSTFSRCLSTFIDGREYFSIAKDKRLRDTAGAARRRLINVVLAQKGGGGDLAGKGGRSGRRRPGRRDLSRAEYRRHLLATWRGQQRGRLGCNCLDENDWLGLDNQDIQNKLNHQREEDK